MHVLMTYSPRNMSTGGLAYKENVAFSQFFVWEKRYHSVGTLSVKPEF